MQLFVVVWRDERWVVVALEHARLLSLELMAALENLAGSRQPMRTSPWLRTRGWK